MSPYFDLILKCLTSRYLSLLGFLCLCVQRPKGTVVVEVRVIIAQGL